MGDVVAVTGNGATLMDMPECPQYAENRCPKSDVRLMAEHGPSQATWYTSFFCRTCRYLFVVWNPAVVASAKRGEQLDRAGSSLMSPRFRGIN
jgi:hypothetical protein